LVQFADLTIVECRLRGKLRLTETKNTNPVSVGDLVEVSKSINEEHNIDKIYPRLNYIIRKSNNLSKQTQILASNIDLVFIIASIKKPKTSRGFIDRILVTSEAYRIPAILFFNKVDLCSTEELEEINRMKEIYSKINYKVFYGSANQLIELNYFKSLFKSKTTLITGHSGVGKSTFINAIDPNLHLKTGIISEFSNKGKHTTTFAEMFAIDADSFIIDTPGIKDFGIVEIDKNELSHYFPEIFSASQYCKYNNCKHINEPNCQVVEEVKDGIIDIDRYYSYLSMLENDDKRH